MKVLLATDGSAHAEIALRLVASLAWPAGTAIRVVAALDTVHLAGPWATMAGEGLVDLQSESVDALGAIVGRAKGALATTGATVEGHVVLGRPSSVIVDGAAEFGADLIVVGSRGQGPIRTMLLGSVSAEVVDQARCPVLVARGPAIERILLAHDGSVLARAAEDLLAGLPPFSTQPVRVVSVMRPYQGTADTVGPIAAGRAVDGVAVAEAESRRHHEAVATAAAEHLGRDGRPTTWAIGSGDPAHVLIEEAGSSKADLIALGTHGRTGLDRLVLGSVARTVLTHAPCSVLIVRAGPDGDPETNQG